MDKIEDAEKYPKILACDFDDTLFVNEFPGIGEPIQHIIEYVKEKKSQGWKLILFTCRGNEALEEAVNKCKEFGIEFDAVNEDIEEVKNSESHGKKSIKPFYDEIVDDKAVNPKDINVEPSNKEQSRIFGIISYIGK